MMLPGMEGKEKVSACRGRRGSNYRKKRRGEVGI